MDKAVDSWAKLELMSGVIGKIIVNHGTQTKWDHSGATRLMTGRKEITTIYFEVEETGEKIVIMERVEYED